MITEIAQTYKKQMLPPQLKDNGDFADNAYIDTCQGGKRWAHLAVYFLVGTTDAAIGSTAEGTAPLIEECDTTDGTYTAVTGAALADAIADDEGDQIHAIHIDLRQAHKRYMQVQAPHAGDGTTGANLAIVGILSKPDISPTSAAEQGLSELVEQ